jgi:hypothetical protein
MTEWHDFFLTVGGGAAALAGLVFVAMSFNLEVVLHDPGHRYRAVGTLAGFTWSRSSTSIVKRDDATRVAM